MDATLLHLLATVGGTVAAQLVMLPLVRKHLLNLHKRVGAIEKHLSIEPPTPPPGFGFIEDIVANGTGRQR